MTENSAEPSTPQVRRSGSRRPASADQERLVRRYLSALETNKAGRGVKRAADAVGNRITKIDELLVSADPLSRVHLTQERIELHAEYVRIINGNHPDQSHLERDFVRVVRSYGDRNGITYAAWRQVGVDAKVLEAAGIHRADKKPPPAAARAAVEQEEKAAAAAKAAPDGAPEDESEPASATTGTSAGAADKAPPSFPADQPAVVAVPAIESPPSTTEAARTRNGSSMERSDPAVERGRQGEVSLDELADLLAEAGPGPAAPDKVDRGQPRLGDDFDPPSEVVPDRPHRSPRASGS